MKRIIYMLLIVVLAVGLNACGRPTDDAVTTGVDTEEPEMTEEEPVEGHFTVEEYMRGNKDNEMRAIYKITNKCGFDIYNLHGDVDFTYGDRDEISEGALHYTGCLSDGQTAYLTASTWDLDPETVNTIKLSNLICFDGKRDFVYEIETDKTTAGDGNYELDTSGDFDTANSLTFSLTERGVNSDGELVYIAEITNNTGGTVESVDYYIDGFDGEGVIVNVGGGFAGDEFGSGKTVSSEAYFREDIDGAGLRDKISNVKVSHYMYYLTEDDENGNNYYEVDVLSGTAWGAHLDV
ncbi:MAG: hypothetical protein IJJ06_02160 [Mogibacterium sp.]|nr:hypothetical protein [Mogibacterium sp.]